MSCISTSGEIQPWGIKWRSSVWFVTTVVGLGIATDLFFYAIIIPVVPFRLESLGYKNVSSLSGWLLFAFSGGVVLSTPPVAWISEHQSSRRTPLIIGLIALMGAQIMFMLAPVYWLMALARIIQGVSSTIVWTVGLALLCETTPESRIGQQIGLAMTGLSVGIVLAPPLGGVLYSKLGFHAPFIFSLGVLALDLVLRLLVIERKDAMRWGVDPAILHTKDSADDSIPPSSTPFPEIKTEERVVSDIPEDQRQHPSTLANLDGGKINKETVPQKSQTPNVSTQPINLNPIQVMTTMLRSRRALAASINALLYAMAATMQEPTLPLRLQQAFGLSSLKVGLVYLGAYLPSLISGIITGKLTDKYGAGIVATVCFALSTPWFVLMAIHGPLSQLIAGTILAFFFSSAVATPLMAELAAVGKATPGLGYSHIYGAFNLAYGIGSALGPLIGGQLYDHVRHGWTAVQIFSTGAFVAGTVMSCFFLGQVSVAARFRQRSCLCF